MNVLVASFRPIKMDRDKILQTSKKDIKARKIQVHMIFSYFREMSSQKKVIQVWDDIKLNKL